MLTWLCHITKPFLGITKQPQGDFKLKQVTPQDKSRYVQPLLVEFSTGRKFLRSGVLFTRNHANPTKIWTFSCSEIRTLNSRSNFWLVRSKIWTPFPAKLFYSKSVAAWLLSWKENNKAGVRVTFIRPERYCYSRTLCLETLPWYYCSTVPCEYRKLVYTHSVILVI